jgi:hypothetical protein
MITKNAKFCKLNFCFYFLDQNLIFFFPKASTKDVQATGKAFSPQGRTSSISNIKCLHFFLFLWANFAHLNPNPYPGDPGEPKRCRSRSGSTALTYSDSVQFKKKFFLKFQKRISVVLASWPPLRSFYTVQANVETSNSVKISKFR